MSTTIIKLKVAPPISEVDIDSIISGWLEVEAYFKANDVLIKEFKANDVPITEHRIELNIDSKLIRDKLERKNSSHSSSMELLIEIKEEPTFEDWVLEEFFKHFIELLFLALNVSRKGGCNFPSCSIDNLNFKKSLYSDSIESAWDLSQEDNWPNLTEIHFSKVWRWMEKHNGLNFALANTDVTKAMAVLLHQSYNSDIVAGDVVQISQVLESFYLKRREPKARGLTRKIPVILGDIPNEGKKWVQDFYTLRSEIVHGDFPLFRPHFNEADESFFQVEEQYWMLSKTIDKGISVILGTLQNLIVNDASKYVFDERIIVNVE